MTKADVQSIFSGVDINAKETVFIIFSREINAGQWVENYEKLNAKTITVTPKEDALLLKGNSYSYLLAYSAIKYILVEETSVKIEMLD